MSAETVQTQPLPRKIQFFLPFIVLLSLVPLTFVYYKIAVFANPRAISFKSLFAFIVILNCCVVCGYQLYFWSQKNFLRTPVYLKTCWDERIPFKPKWIWCYSLLYYFSMGLVSVYLQSIEQGIYIILGGLALLLINCVIFVVYPVQIHPSFRAYTNNSQSAKFLRYIQSFDATTNRFPSIHCALISYIAFSLQPHIGHSCYIFIILIALSCLFTKQDYIVSIPPGLLLGWLFSWIVQCIT